MMTLLLFNEWLGMRGGKATPQFPKQRQVAMATRVPLAAALTKLAWYKDAYAEKYRSTGLVVEFRLLSVSNIEDTADAALEEFGVEMIEKLPRRPEEFV